MKSRLFILLIFCGSLSSAFAQQRVQSSFDHVNGFNLNNAYAGFDSCVHVFVQHKQQWVGVDGAPVTTQAQGHMPLQNNLGVGIKVSSWKAGLLRTTNISGTIAKHLDITSRYRLGAALSVGYNQFNFGTDDAVAFDSDNYLNQSAANGGGVYTDLGILFGNEQLEVGLAIPRLMSTAVNLDAGSESNELNVERYLNAHAAYSYAVNSEFAVRPMLIYRSIPGDGAIVDVKAGLSYLDKLAFNLGYRTNNGLLAALDLTVSDQFRLGYAYDAGMSRLNAVSNGSHELLLGFRMCKPKKVKEPMVIDYFTNGTVTDKSTGQPLVGKSVVVRNAASGASQLLTTDSLGFYQAKVDSGSTYEIAMDDADYESVRKNVTIDPDQVQTVADLPLQQKVVALSGNVTNGNTNAALAGVAVTLSQGTEVYNAITDVEGNFNIPLPGKRRGDALEYELALQKAGYDPYNSGFAQQMDDYETIRLGAVVGAALQLTPEKKPEQISEIIDLQPIRFEVSSAKLTADAQKELDKVVKVLNENPEMRIEIGAHTDCRGSATGNLRLSQKRAESTLKYIQASITQPDRINGQGYGETKPLKSCECATCPKEDHEANRRTEFRIVQ